MALGGASRAPEAEFVLPSASTTRDRDGPSEPQDRTLAPGMLAWGAGKAL